jgi:hypothetical protein
MKEGEGRHVGIVKVREEMNRVVFGFEAEEEGCGQ